MFIKFNSLLCEVNRYVTHIILPFSKLEIYSAILI